MNLNGKQIISIIGAVLSLLMISTAQLTDLFGLGVAKIVVSVAGLGNTIISSVMAVISGTMSQDAQVRQVLDMKGVQHLEVNRDASPALAKLAVDPNVDKIAPALDAQRQVQATAAAAEKAT